MAAVESSVRTESPSEPFTAGPGTALEVGRRFHGSPRAITRTDFVRYAGSSGDFNPMHHDEIRAQAAGEPSVFGHGMFSAGLLATDLARLVGLQNLRGYRVRFTRQSRPGDVVTSIFAVLSSSPDGDQERVELSCELVAGDGTVLVSGSATALLPLPGPDGAR